jgi:hypothetical protein
MDINTEPKLPGRTMISFGIGLDLTADHSHLSKAALENAFYMHPANVGNKKMMLHNHGAVFENVQWGFTLDLDAEIRRIGREGEFVDMRHLLDTTRIRRAVAGVSYISEYCLSTTSPHNLINTDSTGYPAACQAFQPPPNALTLV